MDKIMEILKSNRSDIDFETATALIDDGILDSFDIIAIVQDINNEFDISISVDDLVPENFNTAQAIKELVDKILEDD